MRHQLSISLLIAAALCAAPRVQAQAGDALAQPAGQDQAQAQGRGPGGGRFGRPVQGIVTTVGAGKITVKTEAGDSYDITVADDTRVMENRQPIKLTDIKPGDSVTAMGQVDAAKKTVQAMMVNAVDAATVAKARENLGKTYITGKITVIDADNLKLTVMRTDDVSQVIQVDEGTSFERGNRGVAAAVEAAGGLPMGGGFGGGRGMGGQRGQRGEAQGQAQPAPESITLADIKVGDTIMATGSIKNGAFTVTKMGVSEPGGGRRRPQGQGDPQGPPQPPPQ
jgi:hypothetical protein